MSRPRAEMMPAVAVPPSPNRITDRDDPVADARLVEVAERDVLAKLLAST